MAVTAVTSSYNVRRRKQSATTQEEAPRMTKKVKYERQDVFTPPASPEASDLLSTVQGCYDDDYEDPVLIGIIEFMQRNGTPAMCSREISEALLQEGKVQLAGATPSTAIDASIKQHHKRCTSNSRSNLIQKVADPRYPRKTLYHLANVDPFAPPPSILTPVASISGAEGGHSTRLDQDHDSEVSSSEDDLDWPDTLSNDGQGPFAASLDTRRRMSFTSSSELEFSLSMDDARKAVATPLPSVPSSPMKEASKEGKRQQLNIALPPSPFITPQASDDDEPSDENTVLRLSSMNPVFTKPLLSRNRDINMTIEDDFYDVEVQSPEAVTLDDLDYLLGF